MKNELSGKRCKPCEGGTPPLKGEALGDLSAKLDEGWKVVEEHHLVKSYDFDDFKQALAFTNRVGAVAEEQGHHPDIYLSYGKVEIKIWTHKIDGLTESDFIFAAKVDDVLLIHANGGDDGQTVLNELA
ncbi:MAG: 4a-hydroxytetrahydrobiopterin dehydratase [Kiritimatiellae bacterium]|nr:4a-hydroxytetrahydrobiopterin dehydratase [Kiritimatiellia bacterium]